MTTVSPRTAARRALIGYLNGAGNYRFRGLLYDLERAIEAEASAGLDVERMARADFEVHELRRNNEKWADLPEDHYKQWWRDHAAAVIAAIEEKP